MSKSNTRVNGDDAQSPELTTEERHRLLSNERRRTVLRVLEHEAEATTLAALATAVAAAEPDVDRSDSTVDEDATVDDAVQIELHHIHLPMLDDAGLVDYDGASKRVERTVPASELPSA